MAVDLRQCERELVYEVEMGMLICGIEKYDGLINFPVNKRDALDSYH